VYIVTANSEKKIVKYISGDIEKVEQKIPKVEVNVKPK
jgi:hypothetical protein